MLKVSVRPLTNHRMDIIYRGLNHEGWFVERDGTACKSTSETATGTYFLLARIHPEFSPKTCELKIARTGVYELTITCDTHPKKIFSDPNVIGFLDDLQPYLTRAVSGAEVIS